ncbi:MAG: hypothetical protein IT164_07785 [Bryobacterales bacterium]|nr:hypothetical protein [Bryobacterales bacterium]
MTRRMAVLLWLACAAWAQNEDALRQAFEGRIVAPRIDMPGDSNGVDIRPGEDSATNDFQIAEDIRRYGVGLRKGARAKVTAVHLKKDHIELHLNGGGFGGFKDRMFTSNQAVEKSYEERQLERERRTASTQRRRSIDMRLRTLRDRREREEARMKERAAGGDVTAMSPEQLRRRTSGSRFNIRFAEGQRAPEGVWTPDRVRSVLAPYLEFPVE